MNEWQIRFLMFLAGILVGSGVTLFAVNWTLMRVVNQVVYP